MREQAITGRVLPAGQRMDGGMATRRRIDNGRGSRA
jgi:hypothetical protein